MSHDTKRWTIELDEVEYTFMTQEETDYASDAIHHAEANQY